jgi:hypothetical protein
MGGVVSSIANVFTGADSTRDAGNAAAGQMSQAARDSAAAAQFRPVGMTTAFGTSDFTRSIDPATGMPYISAASYEANPQLQALQNQLMGQYGQGFNFAQMQQQQAAPMAQGAQSLFGLGQQILPSQYNTAPSAEAQALANQYRTVSNALMPTSATPQMSQASIDYANQLNTLAGQVTPTSYDPTAAAQQYYNQQQALMQSGRDAQLAGVRSNLFGTGRGGLGVQTGTGGAPASPEMQAYYNALSQQDAQLAAQSTDIARSRLQQDIGLGTQLSGQAYQTTADASSMARQQMLENAGLALGYGTQAYQTTASAEDLARQRAASDIGLGAGLFGTGGQLLQTQAGVGAGAYSPLQTLLGTSGTVEQMSQMPYQLGIQLGTAQQPGQQAGSQIYQQGLTQAAQTQYGATQAANAQNAGFWGGLISAVGTAAASDINTKENIKLVGRLKNGLNVYSFEYKKEFKDTEYAGHGSFVGVMAQEVEKIIPEAVFTGKDGYKVVDYSLIV